MIKIEAIAAKLDFGTVFPPEKENSKNSCQKTARVALRNMRNNLCCFQRFLRPLTIALVRTYHQPGLKLEKIDILPRYCCSRTAIFSSNSLSFLP